MLNYFFFSFFEKMKTQVLFICKMFIMDANEYHAILGYLLTNVIPPEIKSERYKKKNFVRMCKGIYLQDNKLIMVCADLISLE